MAAYHTFLNPRLTFFEKLDLLLVFVARNVTPTRSCFTSTVPPDETLACFAGYVGESKDRAQFNDPRTINRV